MRVLVLSPHYDDAPLSLGQSLVDGLLARHRVTVGVVFSRSNWTVWFHPTRSRWPLATAIRRSEETVNAARFRYRLRFGGLEETVLRTGIIASESFLNADFDPTAPDAAEALAAVQTVVDTWAPRFDVLLAPLGLGDHVDHQLVREAAHRAQEAGRVVAFYEDRPYACSLTDDAIAAHVAAFDGRLVRRRVSDPMGPAKHGRLWYPSQFDDYFTGAIASDEQWQRSEHLWTLPDVTAVG